jgi:orotidine-5'-phosphate decarboxylase
MTFLEQLQGAERQNGSLLCVGLDPEPSKFPASMKGDASKIYDFCAQIVDATADLAISFKPQIAYFAAHRAEDQLEKLMAHMRRTAPVTLSPFMGFDSVQPYLKHHGKGAFLLCRTSNPGGDDLQNQRLASVEGQPLLYEHIAKLAQGPWNVNGQLGLVVGATYPVEIERVRSLAPTLPLLIPGVGAQGGDAVATIKAGYRQSQGVTSGAVIVSSSRAILYASSGPDFALAARNEAMRTRDVLRAAAQS